jgi:hypothetical protein
LPSIPGVGHICSAGDWLLLKNLHLVAAWLPALEKELHALAAKGGEGGGGVAAGFRLVLTTEAHQHFPSTLLENCLKVRRRGRDGGECVGALQCCTVCTSHASAHSNRSCAQHAAKAQHPKPTPSMHKKTYYLPMCMCQV